MAPTVRVVTVKFQCRLRAQLCKVFISVFSLSMTRPALEGTSTAPVPCLWEPLCPLVLDLKFQCRLRAQLCKVFISVFTLSMTRPALEGTSTAPVPCLWEPLCPLVFRGRRAHPWSSAGLRYRPVLH